MTEASQVSTTPAVEPTCTPDAALIRLCAEHAVNRDAFRADTQNLENAMDPLWLAFERSNQAISAAIKATPPQSMPGIRALAVMALEEPEEDWGFDALRALLAIPQGVA